MRKPLVLIAALVMLVSTAPAATAADASVRGITVSAIGQIKVRPDAVNLSYSISSLRKTTSEALAAVNGIQAQARTLILAAGVKQDDLTTTGLSIYPEYTYDANYRDPILIGYRANLSTTAAIYSIPKAESIIDGLADVSGDLRLSGLSFFIADPTTYEDKMRQLAVTRAKNKASAYAKLLGRRLGSVQYLTETSAPVSSYKWESAVPSAGADKTQIDPGQQTIAISIEVRWSLR